MCCHDVSLFYPGFDTFASECDSLELQQEDTAFVVKFTIAMSRFYPDEKERHKIVKSLLGAYILGTDLQKIDDMDSAITYNGGVAVIFETKNEVGTGGCDSYLETVANYVKTMNPRIQAKSSAPCFLIEIVGTHLAIYGAVYGGCVAVDRLTPGLWLAFQPNNRPAMERLARTLKALKRALGELDKYYRTVALQSVSHDPKFPCFCTYKTDEQEFTITYTEEIKNHVFRGTTNTGNKVVVKFVVKYGSDAHKACAKAGFAPRLLSDEQVTSRYRMVVMEDLGSDLGLQSLDHDVHEWLLQRCQQALKVIHNAGYCHGDFRENNILVVPTTDNKFKVDVRVIDFDWSGITGRTKYPLFMNHTDLQWHSTAYDGMPLLTEHDLHWLDKLSTRLGQFVCIDM